MSLNLEPIGVVHSPFKTKFGTPRQPHLVPSARITIEIFPHPDMSGCLEGLSEFSHLWVIYHFHENTNSKVRGKVHPPRLNGGAMGVYATRSPHRRNPIGLSVLKIERVDNWLIEVSGGDLIDSTPVLDIKPYLPEVESIPEARSGWVDKNLWQPLDVEFAADVKLSEKQKQLVTEILRQDPRPTVYKDHPYRDRHAVYVEDLDVHFEVKNNRVRVLEIRNNAGGNLPVTV